MMISITPPFAPPAVHAPTVDEWPCTHDCTAFFRIPAAELEPLVPAPLVLETDKQGRAHFEIGYARFRASHGLPPFQELSWGIAVRRMRGRGFAFYCPNIASDSVGFLDYNAKIGFFTHRPTVSFRTDFERRSFEATDAHGQTICILRHQPEGSFALPFFLKPFLLGTTEVWTGTAGNLQRRTFNWRGAALVHLAPPVASTLFDHPFFRSARVSRADPIPFEIFSSEKVANATQLFTFPTKL